MDVKGFYDSIGGDYQTAMTRLMKDSLAERFILKFKNDPSFGQLSEAVAAGDWDAAFPAAHTLKGVALNLAFQKLGAAAEVLTDSLRPQNVENRDPAAQTEMFRQVESEYGKVIAQIDAFSA